MDTTSHQTVRGESAADFVAVIMAGGRGQRFWPLSTEACPKQFLDLEQCGSTMLQSTFARLSELVAGPEAIYIATSARYLELVREQLPTLPPDNIIVEPEGRDSGPAIALASLTVARRHGSVLTGFFPADHRIGDDHRFREAVRRAATLARRTRGIVTLGIRPDAASTGFGYIEPGLPLEGGFQVARFTEKPDLEQAQAYLRGGRHLWNAGMFLWHTDTIHEELRRYAPEIVLPLERALVEDRVAEVFPTLPRISIDYALLERTDRAFVVPASFDWDDVGSWSALERMVAPEHDGGNAVVGHHVGLEAAGNIIYLDDERDTLVTLGIEDLVVVKRGHTLFLSRKDRLHDLKRLLADERLVAHGVQP